MDMHFFSHRQPTGTNSKRVQCTAGHGFWYGARGDEKVYYQSRHVGYKTVLTFKYTKGCKEINTNWIMHEFHLKPPESMAVCNKFESMVVCRIHMNKTKKDSEGDFGSAAIGKEEEGTTSAATNVEERPLKRKRVVVNSELHPQVSSPLPSSPSSVPNTPAFVPCNEQEALDHLISTLDENMVTGNEQEAEEAEGQVIAMLLKEHNLMTNHSKAAAASLCELEAPATYEQERLRKRKLVEGFSSLTSYCDTETHSMVETEASRPSSSSPYLSSSWLSSPALDSFEEPQVHDQFTSGVHSFSGAVSEQLKEMGMIMAQDDWKWDDLDIDFGSGMSSLDELMKSFHDS